MSLRRVENEEMGVSTVLRGDHDPAPEAECDEIVRLAATICGMPVGFLTLLDERQQWFRVSEGFKLEETPREIAFCAYAIRQTELFIVHGCARRRTLRHQSAGRGRAADPVLCGDADAYRGGPSAVGTLCVMDTEPRMLTFEQENALQVLGRQASARLELRDASQGCWKKR